MALQDDIDRIKQIQADYFALHGDSQEVIPSMGAGK